MKQGDATYHNTSTSASSPHSVTSISIETVSFSTNLVLFTTPPCDVADDNVTPPFFFVLALLLFTFCPATLASSDIVFVT